MKILLTGSTGFIGSKIISSLGSKFKIKPVSIRYKEKNK